MRTKPRPRRLPFDLDAVFQDLGYEPHPGQLTVHRSRAERRVLACGARWGKSLAAAIEAVLALLLPAHRSRGWIVAPTYDLAERTFRTVSIVVQERLKHRLLDLDQRGQRILLRNLAGGISELKCKSADNPVSLLGEALDFLIVDEAARMKEEVWHSYLSPRLVDRGGWALFLSTPRGAAHWFFQVFRKGERGEPGFAAWASPSWENPHLDPELIEQERARLPEDAFAQEYGAVFLGRETEPCDTCGAPSPTAAGLLVIEEGQEPPRCPTCGDVVDTKGRGLRRVGPDGAIHLGVILLEGRPEEMDQEEDAEVAVRAGEAAAPD